MSQRRVNGQLVLALDEASGGATVLTPAGMPGINQAAAAVLLKMIRQARSARTVSAAA